MIMQYLTNEFIGFKVTKESLVLGVMDVVLNLTYATDNKFNMQQ